MSEEASLAPAPLDSGALLIPFPLEATVSFGAGTAQGPQAIIAASAALESWDDELGRDPMAEFGIATLETPLVAVPIASALDQLETLVGLALEAGKFPLTLGGEHVLTAGAIRPFAAHHGDLAVLHFDAHADLREAYRGELFSHASAMARVLDHAHLTLVQIGVRSLSAGEAGIIEDNPERITVHWARDRANWDATQIVKPLKGRPIYVSFDVDGFDASLMPATGTPEPGGFFFDEACAILRAAAQAGTIVGADVVELAPIAQMPACDVTAAKLAYKILGYALAPP